MDVAELRRQVEHKFAPEPLIAVQALANTFAFEPSEERLLDRESAARWLAESGLAVPGTAVSSAELARLRAFRELLRSLIDANVSGDPPSEATVELARVAAGHPVRLAPATDGLLGLELSPVGSVDELIAQQIGIVFEAQRLGQWPRLKICASDDCRWSFYDSSRNRGGTWCQMEVCGNRVKNRAYRARRARAAG